VHTQSSVLSELGITNLIPKKFKISVFDNPRDVADFYGGSKEIEINLSYFTGKKMDLVSRKNFLQKLISNNNFYSICPVLHEEIDHVRFSEGAIGKRFQITDNKLESKSILNGNDLENYVNFNSLIEATGKVIRQVVTQNAYGGMYTYTAQSKISEEEEFFIYQKELIKIGSRMFDADTWELTLAFSAIGGPHEEKYSLGLVNLGKMLRGQMSEIKDNYHKVHLAMLDAVEQKPQNISLAYDHAESVPDFLRILKSGF
jgi:hypothetical protein